METDIEKRVEQLEKEISELKATNKTVTEWWMNSQKECERLNASLKSIALIAQKLAE